MWKYYMKGALVTEEVKRIDIKEFREKGFLQEANRKFFHPLGLALEVIINDETGEETLGGVWDYREDPEGNFFSDDMIDEKKIEHVKELKNSKRFDRLMAARKYGTKVNSNSEQIKV